MLYKLSVLASKNRFFAGLLRRANKPFGRYREVTPGDLVRSHADGKSFADIGCMWGINGLNSFIAEEAGAREIIAVDVYPESKEFLEEKAKRNSKIKFVQGDINLSETTDTIGRVDVVFCGGVLYHTPDPAHLLTRLRAICGETLILSTCSIPEMPGIRNAAVFYPYLDERQRQVWDRKMGMQKAITGEYEPESGYGNWFWGMTPSCIESLLRCSGFEVKERYIRPFECRYVCSVTDGGFFAESGEWVTPQDADFVKFQR